jgi:hypothetical protein
LLDDCAGLRLIDCERLNAHPHGIVKSNLIGIVEAVDGLYNKN